jgi:hypothetical protein
MKIRNGFVSNSSSSSFLIGIKNKGIKLSTSLIKKALGINAFVKTGSFLEKIIDEAASCFLINASLTTVKKLLESYAVDEIDEKTEEIFSKSVRVFEGTLGSEDGGIESILNDASFDYEDDDIILYKESM